MAFLAVVFTKIRQSVKNVELISIFRMDSVRESLSKFLIAATTKILLHVFSVHQITSFRVMFVPNLMFKTAKS